MRVPLSGPDRVAFLEQMHDATANDVCVQAAKLIATGWDEQDARDVTAGWLRDRAEAVIVELDEFVAEVAA